MAWISVQGVRDRVAMEGRGIDDAEFEEAIAAAIEEVTGALGSDSQGSALAESAVSALATADILDIQNPRDARSRESESNVLRSGAERKMLRYLETRQTDRDPSTADVPAGYVTSLSPTHINLPDTTY